MVSRRDFMRISTFAILGTAAAARGIAEPSASQYGVQLYTVRDEVAKNLPGVLKAIRGMGYSEVESYWDVYNHPAAELRGMIHDSGLAIHSGHFNYEGLDSKLDYAAELGLQYVICPMLPKDMWNSLDGFKRAADQFNLWGDKVRKMGMQFGFHNHDYEFRRFGETTAFEALMSRADPALTCLEMDCYWITQAGRDPVQILGEMGKRIRLLHLKDRKAGFPPSRQLDQAAEHFTPVGTGTIDWKSILSSAKKLGIERLYVEQDNGDKPPLEELRISIRNLRALG
ncbi:MAG TPA: sugar phosphate isomerase/epimerase [Terriglobales bacterium]|nr:sugar phosphate isomerase/epimerase [Terriglobales bacterium]